MIDTSKIYTSNKCGQFKISKYISSRKVFVEFIDTGYVTSATTANILKGSVKDKLFPCVYGVGFIGDGAVLSAKDGVATRAYTVWNGMMSRCYSELRQSKYPTYIGCSVCSEWHNFQIFSLWFDDNYIDGCEIDKDILNQGNKVYSPEKCIFVTHAINKLIGDKKGGRGNFLRGVHKRKGRNRFISQLSMYGVMVNLGSYMTEKHASKVYKKAKLEYIKKISLEQDEPLRSALLSWFLTE